VAGGFELVERRGPPTLVEDYFSDLEHVARDGHEAVDGILPDLGRRQPMRASAARSADGPLDMRMGGDGRAPPIWSTRRPSATLRIIATLGEALRAPIARDRQSTTGADRHHACPVGIVGKGLSNGRARSIRRCARFRPAHVRQRRAGRFVTR
jgi:hypothetical protein